MRSIVREFQDAQGGQRSQRMERKGGGRGARWERPPVTLPRTLSIPGKGNRMPNCDSELRGKAKPNTEQEDGPLPSIRLPLPLAAPLGTGWSRGYWPTDPEQRAGGSPPSTQERNGPPGGERRASKASTAHGQNQKLLGGAGPEPGRPSGREEGTGGVAAIYPLPLLSLQRCWVIQRNCQSLPPSGRGRSPRCPHRLQASDTAVVHQPAVATSETFRPPRKRPAMVTGS